MDELENSKSKLFSSGKTHLSKLLESSIEYSNRLQILKALRVGVQHKVNQCTENDDLEMHIELLEKTIADLDKIFSTNIKSEMSKVITKEEFEFILSHSQQIHDICCTIRLSSNFINTVEVAVQKREIESLKKLIEKIFNDLMSSQENMHVLQNSATKIISKKMSDT